MRSPITFLDSLADTHAADNEATPPAAADERPPDPVGDGVQASGGANRPNGAVRGRRGGLHPGRVDERPAGHGPHRPGRRAGRAGRPLAELSAVSTPASRTGGALTVALSLKRRTDKPAPDSMTLVEHLTELRRRVLISVAAFLVMAVVAFLAYPWILDVLKHPYCQVAPTHCGFYVTGPLDGLALRVKIAAYGGHLPGLAGLAVGAVAVHHPGPQPEGEALRRPLHRGHHRAVHPGRGGRLPDLPPRPAVARLHRRARRSPRSSTRSST